MACLCRFPDESNDQALDRFSRYYDDTLQIDSPAFELIKSNAYENLSTSVRMVQDLTGVELSQDKLLPGSIAIYHSALKSESKLGVARDVGKRLLAIGAGKSNETFEDIVAQMSEVDIQHRDALTVQEQSAIGLKMYEERIDEIASGKIRVAFPWSQLNSLVPFIYPDDLILVTGQSKMGKSSAAHQIAMSNANRMKVLYFHNEDNELKMFLRRIAQAQSSRDPMMRGPSVMGTLDYRNLLSSSVKDPKIMERLYAESNYIYQHIGDNIIYVYCAGWTAQQIVQLWRTLRRQQDIGLVIIDYLNKIDNYDTVSNLGSVPYAMEYGVELIKRESGRKGSMTPCILVQQENEDESTRDTRSSYIKSQVHVSFRRDLDDNGMLPSGRIAVKRANDGMTGSFGATFHPEYMVWVA